MDAVLFLKEKHRMCKNYGLHECPKCGLSSQNNGKAIGCGGFVLKYPEEAVSIVEKWSRENPLKTKKDKFFEVCPNAPKTNGGYPFFGLPRYAGLCEKQSCYECKYGNSLRPLCWDTPYEGDD